MKNTDVGDNQSTRAGRRVRRRDRSRRAPRPVPPSCSSGVTRRGVSERRSARKPQDADGVSVWRSTPDGGLDAGAQTGAQTGAFEHGCSVTGELMRNHTVRKDSWSRGVAKASVGRRRLRRNDLLVGGLVVHKLTTSKLIPIDSHTKISQRWSHVWPERVPLILRLTTVNKRSSAAEVPRCLVWSTEVDGQVEVRDGRTGDVILLTSSYSEATSIVKGGGRFRGNRQTGDRDVLYISLPPNIIRSAGNASVIVGSDDELEETAEGTDCLTMGNCLAVHSHRGPHKRRMAG